MPARPVQHKHSIMSVRSIFTTCRGAQMFKNLQHNVVLSVRAKTRTFSRFLISLAVAGGAAVFGFVFLCVTGYAWLSIQLGSLSAVSPWPASSC